MLANPHIKIALCDDEKADIKYLTHILNKWAEARHIKTILQPFPSAESFLFEYSGDKGYDILMLDIQMEEMSGLELARFIRRDNREVQIVFITGFPDFMPDGYDISALHYLLKPVNEDKLCEVMDKALHNLKQPKKSLHVIINAEAYRIPLSEILYLESQGHYIVIRTASREYKLKMNLTEMLKSLGNGFFRCQRSFIINLEHVRKITRTSVRLDGGIDVPLSRDLYEAANRAVIDFFS